MGLFQRENRYIVIKRADFDKYIGVGESSRLLGQVLAMIQAGREAEGKPEHKYVVVADTWPEYEAVWKMIETRVLAERAQELLQELSSALLKTNWSSWQTTDKFDSALGKAVAFLAYLEEKGRI